MSQGNKITPSDITAWYTQLNSARRRFNLGEITVPTIEQNSSILSTQMNDFNTQMTSAANSHNATKYSPKFNKTQDYEVSSGEKIQGSYDTNILSDLVQWNSACLNYAVNGTCCVGDNGTCCDGHDSTFDTFSGTDTDWETNSGDDAICYTACFDDKFRGEKLRDE